jgi:hypothetical protein
MRILDGDHDRPLGQITLYLTVEEARSLQGQLGDLISKPQLHHVHIEDDTFTKEATIAIYEPSNLSRFDERSRKLIEKDQLIVLNAYPVVSGERYPLIE